MTASGTGWTGGNFWEDGNVWDMDFRDPDVASASDDDDISFDPAGAGVAFYCGHGTCDDVTNTSCSSESDCSPGDKCPGTPPTATSSACVTNTARRLWTSSSGSIHGNNVFYGDGNTRFGEITGHTFGGAGTNGGDDVVFIDNSCGLRPPWFWDQTSAMFAGVTQIAMIMPVSNMKQSGSNSKVADAWVDSGRGTRLATYALANPYSSVFSAWAATIDGAPQTTGPSCPDLTSTYTYGGGHGIGGCGAYISIAWDDTHTDAVWDVESLNWVSAQNTSLKPVGNAQGYTHYECNYDCVTYGFTK